MSLSTSEIESIAQAVIASYPEQVDAWRAVTPGAWGFLAGKAVIRYRDQLGRKLTDAERRAVWAALWHALERVRAQRSEPHGSDS